MSNLKFIHIPKTAGTTIERAANNHGIKWGMFDKSLRNLGACPWHCPQPVNGPMFCVIRNPYDKIISEFRHQHELNQYTPDVLNKWIPNIINRVRQYKHIEDNHLLPQIEYANYCTDAILFERLHDEFKLLLKSYDLPNIELGHHYGGLEQDAKRENKEYTRLTEQDITEENKKIIYEFYKIDFQLHTILLQSEYSKENLNKYRV